LAAEALRRIAELYEIEADIRGTPADNRRSVRQQRSRPLVEAMHSWLTEQLARVSGRSTLAQAIRYALNHWGGLVLYLDDGRLEMDTNTVERAMRTVALGRKNALFAGADEGTSCCPSAYVLIKEEHFGGNCRAPAATLGAARPRGRHPVKRDLPAERSMARCHRSGEPAKFRCRSVVGPSYGLM
jgi:hypothetical protein